MMADTFGLLSTADLCIILAGNVLSSSTNKGKKMKNDVQQFGARRLLALSLIILTVGLPSALLSQNRITVTTIAAPVNALSITDLDYPNSTTPKWLFTITMTTTGQVRAFMRITLDVFLAGGTTYMTAATFTSEPFIINGTRTVTNLELGRGRGIAQSQTEGYIFRDEAKRAFQEVALPSGSMPAGSYRFTVSVYPLDPPNSPPGTSEFTFVLSNPSSPVLIAPTQGEVVNQEFPLFEWQYDGPKSTIAVFEMLPGQRSMEEAASGTPHMIATVTTHSLRYPVSGARPLQPGKTYVWYVAGLVGTAGGTNLEHRSALRTFSVSNTRTNSLSWLLDELESALPTSYKPLFDQIRAQNLSPSGTFRLNGSTISVNDLLNVLNDLRSNPESIGSVNVE